MALIDNCVAYWKLNETSGNAVDSAGSNTGTVTGATPNQAGKIGTSYLWDANTEAIDCGNAAALQLTTVGTLSCWINPSSITGQSLIIGKGSWGGDSDGYNFVRNTSGLILQLAGASTHQSLLTLSGVLATGNWYNIVARWDTSGSGYGAIYVNGSESNNTTLTQVPNSGVYNFIIGNDPSYLFNGFAGNIDEVAVWSRMITTGEITTLYNGGNGLTYPFFTGIQFDNKRIRFQTL